MHLTVVRHFMIKILFTILGIMTVGLCDLKSQTKHIDLGDTVMIIERLTLTEANDRKVDRIKSAQADDRVSDDWTVDDFRTQSKGLEKDYDRIITGLKKKNVKYKELTQNEFNQHLMSGAKKCVYLTNDYSVREEKNHLIITMTFKLVTAEKKVLIDDSAKGLLKQIGGT